MLSNNYLIKSLCILLLFVFVANIELSAQSNCIVARYLFSGNTKDSVGTNHGTGFKVTLTNDRNGKANSAYQFSTSLKSYVSIPYANFFTPNYSYAMWVKVTTIPDYGKQSILVSIGGSGGDQNMQLENNINYGGSMGNSIGFSLTAYQKAGSTLSFGGAFVGTLPNLNEWYHLVVTRDSSFYKVYVNGCLSSTSTNTNGALPFYGNSAFNAKIGSRQNGSMNFDGVIDDVEIYNCALNAAQVSKLYHGNKPLIITKDTTICSADFKKFKLKAPRDYCSYSWVDMANPSTVLGTDSQFTVDITSTKTFRLITSSKDTAYTTVTIIHPNLNIGNDTFYCAKVSDTLKVNLKGLAYQWDNSSSLSYRPISDSGTYHVLFTDSNGCKARDSIKIKIKPNPVFSLGPDTFYCNTFSRILTTLPDMVSYEWNTNDTTEVITTTQKGLYWAELVDSNACVFRDTIVIENPLISAGFTIQNIDSCNNTNRFVFKDTTWFFENSKSKNTFYFGDNSSAGSDSISKSYLNVGKFIIKQIVVSDSACVDSSSQTIDVWPNANIDFDINDSLQCFNGQNFNFTNATSISSGNIIYNIWSMSDGFLDTNIHINNKTFILDSTYKVRLETISNHFCKDTFEKFLTVYPNSQVDFSISDSVMCYNGNSFDFKDLSNIRTGSVSEYIWNLGDGNALQDSIVFNHKYIYTDTFTVSLLTISDFACRDSISKTIIVHPNTNIDFAVGNDTQCYKWNSFDFTNLSTLEYGDFKTLWEFGDNNSDTTLNISGYKYAVNGTYNVQLKTLTNHACRDSVSKIVRIHASPVDSFGVNQDRQCYRGNLFDFTNQSTIAEGNVVSQIWDLDNSDVFSTNNVLGYKYSTEDSFMVSLSSTSDWNCIDTFTKLIVVHPQPFADFDIPNDSQCWQKNYFNINNFSNIKYGNTTSYWSYGDGTYDTIYQPQTKKYANKSAQYKVKYLIESDYGCQDSMSHDVILFERPIADFGINDTVQCFNTHLFKFNNQTTFSAMNTVSYFWNYGNGDTSIGYTPKDAVYSSPVYQQIELIAYSYLTNCYDTTYKYVLPAPHSIPNFTINKDSQCLRTNQFDFNSSSALTFGTMKYKWLFGDGNSDTFKQTTNIYNGGNNFNVKLLVTTNYNCVDSISKPIVVLPHPVAKFNINDTAQCLNAQSFDFTDASNIQYGSYTNQWIFDDNSSLNSTNVSNKTFNNNGFHKVVLALTSNFNCVDTTSRMVFLEDFDNTRMDVLSLDSQCFKGNSFDFKNINLSSSVIHNNFEWQMGDGNTKVGAIINHQYQAAGDYQVLLITTSANNCKDSGFADIVVHPNPQNSFSCAEVCFVGENEFTDESSISKGSIVEYKWNFENGGTSNLQNPKVNFMTPGYYDAELITKSDKGCYDTLYMSDVAWLKEKPIADFTFKRLPDKAFDVATLQFTNLSSSDVVNSYWDFGNMNNSNEFEPEADFNDTLERKITLVVTNQVGCKDTTEQMTGSLVTDFVFYMPTAFSPDNNNINDVLKPVSTPYVNKYIFQIYNRWGEMVFETNDILQGWDGTYNGEPCEQGVYLCKVYLIPKRGQLQSHELMVTLIR